MKSKKQKGERKNNGKKGASITFRKKKKRVFLCFTPPENEFGNQLFWILGSSSTFRLFHSYESKKVSGRFPNVRSARASIPVVGYPFRTFFLSSIRHVVTALQHAHVG